MEHNHRMISLNRSVLVAMYLCTISAIAVAQNSLSVLTIEPAHPSPGDSIVARIFMPTGGCTPDGTKELIQNGRNLRIIHTIPVAAISLLGPCTESFSIGVLPVGRFHLDWEVVLMTSPPLNFMLATLSFSVGDGGPPDPVPAMNSLALLALMMIAMLGPASAYFRIRHPRGPYWPHKLYRPPPPC